MEEKRILESEELEKISGGLQDLPEGVEPKKGPLTSLVSAVEEKVGGKGRTGIEGILSKNKGEVELIATTAGKDRPGKSS